MTWQSCNPASQDGQFLFRFLSEDNLCKFLLTGNIWFARADTFGDKMECVSVDDFKARSFELEEMKKRQKTHFVSCWHLNTNESLALWDTYAKTEASRRKYAIRFGKDELIQFIITANQPEALISSAFYGNLEYKNLISANAKSILKAKVKKPSLRKDEVFSYEKEFRFVLRTSTTSNKLGINIHLGNPKNLTFKLLINPLLEKQEFTAALRHLQDSEFKSKIGFSKLIKWLNPPMWATIEKHTKKPH